MKILLERPNEKRERLFLLLRFEEEEVFILGKVFHINVKVGDFYLLISGCKKFGIDL